MDIKKNLIEIKECPICKNSKFTKLGKINNLHQDLKNYFDLTKSDQMNIIGIKK